MEEREGEHVLREEIRRLHMRMNVLSLLTMLAVAAGAASILLVLRRTPNTNAPDGLGTVIADRVMTRELFVVQDPGSLAMDLQRPPFQTVRLGGRAGGSVAMRPGEVHLSGRGEQVGMLLFPGSITLLAGLGRAMEISPDSLRMGVRLYAPDGRRWHFPDSSTRSRPR